jgi:hypothetical protein
MRMFTIGAALLSTALVHAAPQSVSPIDLDRPGAMEAVQLEKPEHFGKIAQIRTLASRMPCFTEEFGRTLQVRFEARDASCGVLLMTSYPSKRRLSFALGGVRYVTVVAMDESGNRLTPANEQPGRQDGLSSVPAR